MRTPRIGDTLQFFDEFGSAPTAAIVTGHHRYGLVDLVVFSNHSFATPSHRWNVIFVPTDQRPPREDYCSFPPEPVVRIPGNVCINVKE
jgi:hypothetical protein